MKYWTYVLGLIGLLAVTALVLHQGFDEVIGVLIKGGWPLLWLVPLHILPMLCDTFTWRILLQPNDPDNRANFGWLYWVVSVREAIGRLLPLTNLAGDVAGVHLARQRLPTGPVVASVIGEIFTTVVNQYLFSIIGALLLISITGTLEQTRTLMLGLLFALPIPILFGLTLHFGAVFRRIETILTRMLGSEIGALIDGHTLDREMRAVFARSGRLIAATLSQLFGFFLSALETWLALYLLGHPVSLEAAIALEAVTLAIRNLIFFIPGSLGVQEAGLMIFGQMLGIDAGTSLSLSLAKRAREILYSAPYLLWWQWDEAQRLRSLRAAKNA